jgi:hypothetical protein
VQRVVVGRISTFKYSSHSAVKIGSLQEKVLNGVKQALPSDTSGASLTAHVRNSSCSTKHTAPPVADSTTPDATAEAALESLATASCPHRKSAQMSAPPPQDNNVADVPAAVQSTVSQSTHSSGGAGSPPPTQNTHGVSGGLAQTCMHAAEGDVSPLVAAEEGTVHSVPKGAAVTVKVEMAAELGSRSRRKPPSFSETPGAAATFTAAPADPSLNPPEGFDVTSTDPNAPQHPPQPLPSAKGADSMRAADTVCVDASDVWAVQSIRLNEEQVRS